MATASSLQSTGKTKQRVVGTAVLVALFIIIVLILPSRNGEEPEVLQAVEIPPKPADLNVKVLPFEVPKPPRQPVFAEEPDTVPAPAPAPNNSAAKPNSVEGQARAVPKLHNAAPKRVPVDNANQQWVIQVGSFSSKENAVALRDRLKSDNYKVFVDKVSSHGKPSYRVLIGPNANRAKLEPFKVKLEKLLNAPALIKAYEP